jgi:hypothetical protein
LIDLLETLKPFILVLLSVGHLPPLTKENLLASLPFIIPSLIYGVQNNLYFLALTLISPPIWMILVSLKTVMSAAIYKVALCVCCRRVKKKSIQS